MIFQTDLTIASADFPAVQTDRFTIVAVDEEMADPGGSDIPHIVRPE